jgi:hypothetical protein
VPSLDILKFTCCDHGYGRPSWRPRVSDPATYRTGTLLNQSRGTPGRVARWRAHPLRAHCAPLGPASGFPVSPRSLCSAQSRKRVPSFFALAVLRSIPQAGSQFHGLATAIEAPCSPPAADRESSKCKEVIPFHCSSLATPAARLVDELKSCRSSRVATGNALAEAFS